MSKTGSAGLYDCPKIDLIYKTMFARRQKLNLRWISHLAAFLTPLYVRYNVPPAQVHLLKMIQ